MKFLLMCCINEERWNRIPERMETESCEPTVHGWKPSTSLANTIASGMLRPSSSAKTVRAKNGRPVVTDGPFAETKEQFGGYHLVDCKDLDEAIALAAGIPTLPVGGTIEVRAVESAF